MTPGHQFARCAGLVVGVFGVLVILGDAAQAASSAGLGDAAVLAQGLMARIISPNLTFLAITIGAMLVLFEVATPGGLVFAVIGGILLVIGLMALTALPVSFIGVLLLLVSLGLVVGEPFIPGVGFAATVGGLGLVLAANVLFTDPRVAISPGVLIPAIFVLCIASVGVSIAMRQGRDQPSIIGADAMVGRAGTVRTSTGNSGQVFVDGATWRAKSTGAELVVGQPIRVVSVDRLSLIVEPAPPDGATEGGTTHA